MTKYQPPALTDDERKRLAEQLVAYIRARGVAHIPKVLSTLVIENASLTLEINRLRKELGIPERDTYELK